MKIKSITIDNFRGYKDPVTIPFDNLTVFVGKNDIGKSTILEALDIFFNDSKAIHKLEKDDINKDNSKNGNNDIIISVEFIDIPDKLILDESAETNLEKEFLLNASGNLEIVKSYKDAGKAKTYIKAFHPNHPDCNDLLLQKIKGLKEKVKQFSLDCPDSTKKCVLRKTIWEHFHDDLQCSEREIETSGDDLKDIWLKLQAYMPIYSLFQSDRSNSDKDKEAQDPLKEAVKVILADREIQSSLAEVAQKVHNHLEIVTNSTLEKLKTMNPQIANTLHPNLPSSDNLGWADVFKGVSITSDNDIPINKRGSGVKRLVLINFFRAEAERMLNTTNHPNVIYAIEEPETAQHIDHQRKLIKALIDLSENPVVQIILTTHSSFVVKQLKFDNIRLISEKGDHKTVECIDKQLLPFPSLNEINFSAFKEISEEYHNELYGYLQAKASDENKENERECEFDKWLEQKGCTRIKIWKRKSSKGIKTQWTTLPTYIRNFIHHPENNDNSEYTIEELKQSIELLRNLFC